MKKGTVIALLLCFLAGCLFGCRSKEIPVEPGIGKQVSSAPIGSEPSLSQTHRIEVVDYKGILSECPKSALAGEKVTIKTNSFMDAMPKIDVSGTDTGEWDKGKTQYTFIMPDEDVKLTATLKSFGEG